MHDVITNLYFPIDFNSTYKLAPLPLNFPYLHTAFLDSIQKQKWKCWLDFGNVIILKKGISNLIQVQSFFDHMLKYLKNPNNEIRSVESLLDIQRYIIL